jgi:hypothetical protein
MVAVMAGINLEIVFSIPHSTLSILKETKGMNDLLYLEVTAICAYHGKDGCVGH